MVSVGRQTAARSLAGTRRRIMRGKDCMRTVLLDIEQVGAFDQIWGFNPWGRKIE